MTVLVREAAAGDYDAYARLFPELGVDEAVPARDKFVAEIAPRTLIATDGEAIVGYALFEVLAELGYVRNLVSDPAHRRRGIGAALMEAMRARFVAAGATGWCLNVKPDNVAAVTLYERCGMRTAHRTQVMRVPAAVAVPPPPGDVLLAPVAPEEDAALEETFHLARGQLASARARPARDVVQLRRGGAARGVGVWMAHVPGSFPFRLADPTLAAAFVAHLRARAPAAPWVQVSAEDDDALAAAVLALGGELHMELLHLRGPLA